MKKILNALLFLSFIVTVMEPITGIYIHKPAAAIFLLSGIFHIITYWKKTGGKSWLLLMLTLFSFLSGLFSLILEQYFILLTVHRCISIALVFFLGIHVSLLYKKMFRKK